MKEIRKQSLGFSDLQAKKEKLKQYSLTYILERVRREDGFGLRYETDFSPKKNDQTVIAHLSLFVASDDFRDFRLVITEQKWLDKYTNRGGADAISLFQYVIGSNFKDTLNWLDKILNSCTGKVLDLHSKREPVTKLNVIYDVDILGWLPKCDMPTMEFPFFALKPGLKTDFVYKRDDFEIFIGSTSKGRATIFDKDIWLYCIYLATQEKEPQRTVKFKLAEFLRATKRDTQGISYKRVVASLQRLRDTSTHTNIKTNGRRYYDGFGLIESYRLIRKDPDREKSTVIGVEINLASWLLGSLQANKQILALNPLYLELKSPLQRRIYEIARKHCGKQKKWHISLENLHFKSGSGGTLREFRRKLKPLLEYGSILEYKLVFDTKSNVVEFLFNDKYQRN